MITASQLAIESHLAAATIYLSGPLTVAAAARAIQASHRLPGHVRAVRLDLRSVTLFDTDALTMLEVLMLEWRAARRGVSHFRYPRLGTRDAFVAIPCAIRDAPDAQLRPECDDRVVSTPSTSDWYNG